MPRVDPDILDGSTVVPIYLAATVSEAEQVEAVLTEKGVDYVIEIEKFETGFFFRFQRSGAMFYVLEEQAGFCRSELLAAGLLKGLADGDQAHSQP